MNNRTLKTLIIGLMIALSGGVCANEEEDNIALRVLKLIELQDKFGNYQLTSGDAACEHNLTLQKVDLELGGSPMSVVELVATEIAADNYIWRKGMSTLFVQINGKKVHDRSINSRNQAFRTEYRATYEKGVLTSTLEYKNSFALIRLDKEAIVTTLDFNVSAGAFSYRQQDTDEDKNTIVTNCEYERVY